VTTNGGVLRATYRVQLNAEFALRQARAIVPYLDDLGVSHLYCSPVLAARRGSTHGYDVVDPTRVDPELGDESDFRGLAADLHARGMGLLLDIVPNHMSATAENSYWDDVLRHGEGSRWAHWFDIDWSASGAQRHRVVLPVLGDELDRVIERGELIVRVDESGTRVSYFDKSFPVDPTTGRPTRGRGAALIGLLALPMALVLGTLVLVGARTLALARPGRPSLDAAAPLAPRELVRLHSWERRLRRVLVLAAIGYLAVVVSWWVGGGDAVGDPRLALALLAAIFAAGAAAQFSARCPRCGYNLGFQARLRLPEGCERCGGELR